MARVDIPVRTTGAKKAETQFKQLGKSMAAMAIGYVGIGIAVTKITGLMKEAVNLWGQQELAEKKLFTAYGKSITELKRYASSMQDMTTFGDEATLGAMSRLAAFTKEEDQLKDLTLASIEMASALTMDLNAAADLIGKTLGSTTNALTRYGVAVDGAVGSTERAASITKGIAELWAGQAAAAAETFTGKVQQLSNAWGDLLEQVGRFAATGGEASGVFKFLMDTINEFGIRVRLVNILLDLATGNYETLADRAEASFLAQVKAIQEKTKIELAALTKTENAYGEWIEALEKAQEKEALELEFMQRYIEGSIGVVEMIEAQIDAQSRLTAEIDNQLKPMEKIAKAVDMFKPKLSDAALAAQEVGDQLISTFDYVFTETLIQEQAFGDAMVAGFRSMLERMIADLLARSVVFGILGLIPGIGGIGSFLDFVVKPAVGISGISPTVSERGGGGSVTNINMPNVTMINSKSISQLNQALTRHKRLH